MGSLTGSFPAMNLPSLPLRTRRHFLRDAAFLGGAVGLAPYLRGAEAGKKYRTALIGSGWWGKNILREAIAAGSVKVVGLCDVDRRAREVAAEQVKDLNGDEPKTYNDYRELLEKEKPEIVLIATPDHWHALQTIAAVKAGAHVFVEKPTGHTVNESRAMLRAARECGRVVQVGLHRRIGPHHVNGMKFLKSGAVGEVGMVRIFAHGMSFRFPLVEIAHQDHLVGPGHLYREFNPATFGSVLFHFSSHASTLLIDSMFDFSNLKFIVIR